MSGVVERRQLLVERVRGLLGSGECLCWSEVLLVVRGELLGLAVDAGVDPLYLAFAVVDDFEAELEDWVSFGHGVVS